MALADLVRVFGFASLLAAGSMAFPAYSAVSPSWTSTADHAGPGIATPNRGAPAGSSHYVLFDFKDDAALRHSLMEWQAKSADSSAELYVSSRDLRLPGAEDCAGPCSTDWSSLFVGHPLNLGFQKVSLAPPADRVAGRNAGLLDEPLGRYLVVDRSHAQAFSVASQAMPEPGTFALLSVGFVGILIGIRYRRGAA